MYESENKNINKNYLKEFQLIREQIRLGESTWQDIVNLRYRYNRPNLSKDTIRKGVLFYDEFNDSGCVDVTDNMGNNVNNMDDFVTNSYVNAKVIRAYKDGNYTSEKVVKISEEDLNNPREIMKSHGFNPDEYDLISARSSKWQQGNGDNGVKDLYSSRITVKPKKVITDPKWYENLLNDISIKHTNSKHREYLNNENGTNKDRILVIALDDLHWGRFAWGEETGEDYNMEIARERIMGNVGKIVNKFINTGLEEVIVKLGSDFLNSNYNGVTSLHKNPQDNDGIFKKIFSDGIELIIDIIDLLSDIAPVECVWVNGNHGSVEEYMLGKCISLYYARSSNIIIDADASLRKYRTFGTNLIGFTHGDKEKKEVFGNLMACEVPEAWAKTTEHVFLVGHLHHIKEKTFEENGVIVYTVPSVVSDDAWTDSKGFTSRKRTQCFIFDKEEGLVETHYFNINN